MLQSRDPRCAGRRSQPRSICGGRRHSTSPRGPVVGSLLLLLTGIAASACRSRAPWAGMDGRLPRRICSWPACLAAAAALSPATRFVAAAVAPFGGSVGWPRWCLRAPHPNRPIWGAGSFFFRGPLGIASRGFPIGRLPLSRHRAETGPPSGCAGSVTEQHAVVFQVWSQELPTQRTLHVLRSARLLSLPAATCARFAGSLAALSKSSKRTRLPACALVLSIAEFPAAEGVRSRTCALGSSLPGKQ